MRTHLGKLGGRKVAALCLLASTCCPAARAQYAIDWWTADGGGGISSGGGYTLGGTIGQPDAGKMTGGGYTLVGGFWGLDAAIQTAPAPLLTITLNPQLSTVTLSWPSPSTGFRLEQCDSLTSPDWTPVGTTPTDNGTIKSVPLDTGPGNKFYRLIN